MNVPQEEKDAIDAMSRYEMCRMWRFAKSGEPLLQGMAGGYFAKRLMSLGGVSPEISKSLEFGW